MVYGYIRVSTDKQTVENQRFEIERFCKKEGLTIDGWIEETISGTKNYSKRALGKLLNRIVKDDLIICTELSRLGRNLFMIMEILNICMTKESRVWTIKDNYRLGDDIQSKVLAFAFGLSAEIERNLISQRTKEALARLKKEGHQVGRGQGQRNKQLNAKCVAKHKYIEGFCWNNLLNPNARLLKVKLKGESVNDVGSMSLYTTNILSNKYIVALLNSNILFDYYREFINCSVNVQINDIKQLPIIIPTKSLASSIELWADKAIKKKQESANENLEPIEVEIEDLIKILYSI